MPLTQVSPGLLDSNAQYYGFKNRIINGGMVIDQRNAGASVTPTASAYTVDRWQYQTNVASKMSVQRNAGSVTTPVGFSNYLGLTTVSAYTAAAGELFEFTQKVEGFNFSDLAWGTASAATVTLSFWVRSSLTGTHSGSFTNEAGSRSYPFTFTISSANTWEYKTITVAGDTTGTWVGATNGAGVLLYFDMGSGSTFRGTAGAWSDGNFVGATGAVNVVGTNGATFYITGVQLEKGSVATSFDYRPYGTELALCQRYYFRRNQGQVAIAFNATTSRADAIVPFQVSMRADPTALEQSGTASDYRVIYQGTSAICTSVPTFSAATVASSYVRFNNSAVFTVGQACIVECLTSAAYLGWSAEL
jgi:hypothetical protein